MLTLITDSILSYETIWNILGKVNYWATPHNPISCGVGSGLMLFSLIPTLKWYYYPLTGINSIEYVFLLTVMCVISGINEDILPKCILTDCPDCCNLSNYYQKELTQARAPTQNLVLIWCHKSVYNCFLSDHFYPYIYCLVNDVC